MKQENKDLQEYISQTLKRLRKQKGVSQQDVYNDTEIHIGRIEANRVNVTVNTLFELCSYFGITLKEFFSDYK